jgi:hypothetical protein
MFLGLAASYLHDSREGIQLYHLIVHICFACSLSVYIYGCNALPLQ